MTRWIESLPLLNLRHCVGIVMAMALAGAAVPVLTPDLQGVSGSPQFEASVPESFGDWKLVRMPQLPVDVVADDGRGTLQQPYDETVMRTYRNSKGEIVMLALAYGREQRQEVKVHRPELCYTAAGFNVASSQETAFGHLQGAGGAVRGKRLYAEGRRGNEAVSYWIRIGGVYTESGWDIRRHIVMQGLQGQIPDGILVRASRTVDGRAQAEKTWPQLEAFLVELAAALPEQTRSFLVR
jgi:EpsI family protein